MNLCGVGYEFTLINYDVLEVDEKMLLFFFSPLLIAWKQEKKTFLRCSTKGRKLVF